MINIEKIQYMSLEQSNKIRSSSGEDIQRVTTSFLHNKRTLKLELMLNQVQSN